MPVYTINRNSIASAGKKYNVLLLDTNKSSKIQKKYPEWLLNVKTINDNDDDDDNNNNNNNNDDDDDDDDDDDNNNNNNQFDKKYKAPLHSQYESNGRKSIPGMITNYSSEASF